MANVGGVLRTGKRGRPQLQRGEVGEPWATRRDDGRWVGRVQVRRIDGSRTRVQLTDTEPRRSSSRILRAVRDAGYLEARRQVGTEATADRVEVGDSMTVAQLCTAYLDWKQADRPASTMSAYRGAVKNYIANPSETPLGSLTVAETTTRDLDAVAARLTTGTWRTVRAVVGGAYKWGAGRGVTVPNPVPGTRTAPRARPILAFATAGEVRAWIDRWRLWSAAGLRGPRATWWGPYMLILLATGARRSEALRIRWEDVRGLDDDSDDAVVVVGIRGAKTKNGRTVEDHDDLPVSRWLTVARFGVEALREQRAAAPDGTPWVFPSSGTGHQSTSEISKTGSAVMRWQPKTGDDLPPVPRFAGKAGKPGPLTPHVLRRTVGDWIADARGVEYEGEALGHSTGTVTSTYYRRGSEKDVADIVQKRWEDGE